MAKSILEGEVINRRSRWATALYSGAYIQGRGKLLKDGKYCCLGVACEVFRPELGILSWEGYPDEGMIFEIDGDQSSLSLPDSLRRYLGLSANAQNLLINLNDSIGAPFPVIASVVMELAIVSEEEQE
jgi:hypothetical protein